MSMRTIASSLLAVLMLLLGACAGTASRDGPTAAHDPDRPDTEYLARRAIERWELLIARRTDAAYDYLSPGFREMTTREAYVAAMAARPMRWKAARPSQVDCPKGEGFCSVTSLVTFSIPSTLQGMGQLEAESPVFERWIWAGGDWYLVPKEVAR